LHLGVTAAVLGFALLLRSNGIASEDCSSQEEQGLAAIRAGQIQAGLGHLQQGVASCPTNARAHYDLGFGLLVDGQAVEAAREFKAAIGIDSQFQRAYYQLGVALARAEEQQGDRTGNYNWDPAIEQLRMAIKLGPSDADAHFNLATLLARKKASAEALKEIRQCMRLRPNYAGAKSLLGSLLYMEGSTEEAIPYLRQAVEEDSHSLTAHDYLAVALMHVGQTQEAIEQWEVVAHLDPDYATVHYDLARALEKIGRKQEAAVEMSEFQRLDEAAKRRRKVYREEHPF